MQADAGRFMGGLQKGSLHFATPFVRAAFQQPQLTFPQLRQGSGHPMKYRLLCLLLSIAVPSALLATPEKSDDPSTFPTKKILFFSKSAGYEHSVIKDGSRPFKPAPGSEVEGLAFQVLKTLGAKDNIEFVFSKDGSLFTPAYLAQFDAYFFHTTGDLTTVGTDGNPAMTPEGKAAFLQAIANGKGFIGTHCATDTFHSPGNAEHGDARYHNDGDNADPYIKMIGGNSNT